MTRNLGILSGISMLGTAIASVFWSEIRSFKDSRRKELERKEARKFKNRYSSALLNLGDLELWDKKNTTLRSHSDLWGNIPTHPILKRAWEHRSADSIEKSRTLHREGCRNIYESSDRKYFDDFKNHCSKSNTEGILGTWITNSSNSLSNKISNFGNVDVKELSSEFTMLRRSINSSSLEEFKPKLVEVCNKQKKNIYMGEKDLATKNIKSFCIEN